MNEPRKLSRPTFLGAIGERLYSLMPRNAVNAASEILIPLNHVVELDIQVER